MSRLGGSRSRSIVDKDEIKRQIGSRDAVLHLFKAFPLRELDVRGRWLKVKSRTIEDSFILGHPTPANSEIGLAKLGDRRGAETTTRIVASGAIHREWFFDTEFKDVAATSANWDDTAHILSMI